jgi:hypothetical protein
MGHTKGRTLMGGGRVSEENKEGEYGWCTFYTSMNMGHSKHHKKRTKVGRRIMEGKTNSGYNMYT